MPFMLKTPNGDTVETFHRARTTPPRRIDVPGVGVVFGPAEGWTGHGGYTLVWADPPTPNPQPPSVADVRMEAERRITSAWPIYKQLNMLRTGTAQEIADMGAAIDAIRAASNVLEALDPIPADYADDARWP